MDQILSHNHKKFSLLFHGESKMKHILPLTYEPKIADVRDGFCIQTIRPGSESRPKNVGDFVMFHGWSGVPYRSKWNWRTPYMKIIDTFYIKFLNITSNNTVALLKELPPGSDRFDRLTEKQANDIARLDGLDNFENMTNQFKMMYGGEMFDILFQVIRWDPYKDGEEQFFKDPPEKDCSTQLDDFI